MKVLIDTHTLIWFLFARDKLSDKALDSIFSASIVFTPTLVLLEAFHVSRKLKIDLEIHDRVIVSSAKLLDLPIVTRDEKISKLYPKTIW